MKKLVGTVQTNVNAIVITNKANGTHTVYEDNGLLEGFGTELYNYNPDGNVVSIGSKDDFDATEFLNRIYTNPFAKLPIGKSRYGIMLRDDGIVLDDVTHTVYPGAQSLIFNFMVPVGNDYQLGVDGSSGNIGLFRSN